MADPMKEKRAKDLQDLLSHLGLKAANGSLHAKAGLSAVRQLIAENKALTKALEEAKKQNEDSCSKEGKRDEKLEEILSKVKDLHHEWWLKQEPD